MFTSPQGLRLAYWDGQERYRCEWLVMPAEGLRTDITGLRLIFDELFRARLDQACDQLGRCRR